MIKTSTRKYVTTLAKQIEEAKQLIAEIYAICKRLGYAKNVADMASKYTGGASAAYWEEELETPTCSTECGFIYDIFIASGLKSLGDGAYRIAFQYKDVVIKIATEEDFNGCQNAFELRQYKNMLKNDVKYLALPLLGSMKIRGETILFYPIAKIGYSGDSVKRFDTLEETFCDMHSGNYGTFMGMVFATDFGGHENEDYKNNSLKLSAAQKKKAEKVLRPFFELKKKTLKRNA